MSWWDKTSKIHFWSYIRCQSKISGRDILPFPVWKYIVVNSYVIIKVTCVSTLIAWKISLSMVHLVFLQIASSLVYFSTTQTRRYIFPCLTLMVFQILNALILLPTQTAFTYYLWPMISLVSIHIIDTMTLFLTLTLHSWSTFKVYIVFFQTTDALKLFLTQTALTFPWPMVSNMVYQITDTMKMLLKQNLCVILAILWFMHRVFQKAVVFLTNAFWNKLTFQLSTSSLIGSLGWFGLAVSAYC